MVFGEEPWRGAPPGRAPTPARSAGWYSLQVGCVVSCWSWVLAHMPAASLWISLAGAPRVVHGALRRRIRDSRLHHGAPVVRPPLTVWNKRPPLQVLLPVLLQVCEP